ncbi:MAG: High-affinity branched-chain amino acid transport system permease protein LivH [Alphaproteobacteria bacterium MarineAlpha9_Bin2]|nr:MAG: High-affinity branched-chain amino acid transport system permease protein LivH [Alphaproteobacteria bacterium MarineAlpha9_Bin1]PPR31256.1 MAG: High-affinity branched-chain amino acid transport system permease protein LivH [Alphaproteobacteria bacterium MarineAlpha9_Bin2]
MDVILFTVFNSVLYGMLLFMLSSGLTLIFGMMGILNFAHASFFMLGAYFAYQISEILGFYPALFIAPIIIAFCGALVERYGLRRVHKFGHVAELLFTFGLFYIIEEIVQMIWGKVPVGYHIPLSMDFPLFTLMGMSYPAYQMFTLTISVAIFLGLFAILTKTRAGLIIKAALTHPEIVSSLGHNVPKVFMMVFGLGCGLAGLAGVLAGNTLGTEPAMALMLGPIVFVVIVVGGLGSLKGALVASILIGLMQTFAISLDYSINSVMELLGLTLDIESLWHILVDLTISQLAPILPYLLLVVILIARPRGLFGTRDV